MNERREEAFSEERRAPMLPRLWFMDAFMDPPMEASAGAMGKEGEGRLQNGRREKQKREK
jgi:hypothetical protein